MAMTELTEDFYTCDCLDAAPSLVGKLLVRTFDNGEKITLRITETEAYRGEEDTACHASKGRTPRTEMLYRRGGTIYVYLCYGIHSLMNIITGGENVPQGVLIRACQGFEGPGRLTKRLNIDRSFNGEFILNNPRIAIYDDGLRPAIALKKRVGIDYAQPSDRDRLWRFVLDEDQGVKL